MLRDLAVLALDPGLDPLAGVGDGLHPRAGQDRHALLGQRLFKEGGDVGVFHRHHPVHHFDHGHSRAKVVIEAGEFDPDCA